RTSDVRQRFPRRVRAGLGNLPGGGLLRLPLRFLLAKLLASLGTVGERLPGGFGPAATLAHMIERRRVRLGPRLLGTGEEELKVRAADDHPLGQLIRPAEIRRPRVAP